MKHILRKARDRLQRLLARVGLYRPKWVVQQSIQYGSKAISKGTVAVRETE